MKRTTIQALAVVAAALIVAACSSRSGGVLGADTQTFPDTGTPLTDTGGGGGTDSDTPKPDIPGGQPDIPLPGDIAACEGTTTLSALQQDPIGIQCDASVAFLDYPDTMTLCNLIVVSPRMDVGENLYAYFVAQGTGPNSGAQLTVSADLDANYAQGTVLKVFAEGQEFYCLTQVKALQAPEVLGMTDVPAAAEVAPETLAPEGDQAEPYESTLVKVTNVHVAQGQSWGFTLVEGGVEVSDALDLGIRPAAGCVISSIRGVLTYSFEKYQIIPLSTDDVVYDPATDCPAGHGAVTEIQAATASAECPTFNDSSAVYPEGGSDLVLNDLIITSPQVYVSSNLRGYYVQDAAAAAPEYSGVLVRFFKDSDPGFVMGDIVTVRGDWQEFHCLTQIAVDFPDTGAQGMEKTGAGTVPDPIDVDAARLATEPAYAEPWEGVLVKVGPQVVAELPDDANHFQVTFESGLKLEDHITYHYDDLVFSPGQTIQSITGIIAGSTFDEGDYFLLPRGAGDFTISK